MRTTFITAITLFISQHATAHPGHGALEGSSHSWLHTGDLALLALGIMALAVGYYYKRQ